MDELRELYQEMILDHYKRPRNYHKLDGASHSAEGHNPLCGDRITIYLLVENDKITDICFEGSGCAICTASASVMTEMLKGKMLADAEILFGRDELIDRIVPDLTLIGIAAAARRALVKDDADVRR